MLFRLNKHNIAAPKQRKKKQITMREDNKFLEDITSEESEIVDSQIQIITFGYDHKGLQKIWDKIKQAYSPSDFDSGLAEHKRFEGIAPTLFDLEEYILFENAYSTKVKKHHEHENSTLRFSTEDILALIQGTTIEMHHRSCAGQLRQVKNNTLCIHYITQENKKGSVAFPGVNYIPTKALLNYWKKEHRRDAEVIDQYEILRTEYKLSKLT